LKTQAERERETFTILPSHVREYNQREREREILKKIEKEVS
jgi:hypothetical protein